MYILPETPRSDTHLSNKSRYSRWMILERDLLR